MSTPKGQAPGTSLPQPHMLRRNCQFGRLAVRYYPERAYSRAVFLFWRELQETEGLLPALRQTGYADNQRLLTPRQIRVIAQFLGEP